MQHFGPLGKKGHTSGGHFMKLVITDNLSFTDYYHGNRQWQCFIANQNQECHCTCQWMTNCQWWQVSWNAHLAFAEKATNPVILNFELFHCLATLSKLKSIVLDNILKRKKWCEFVFSWIYCSWSCVANKARRAAWPWESRGNNLWRYLKFKSLKFCTASPLYV